MKFIERLGASAISHWYVWIFAWSAVFFAIDQIDAAKTVTLDAKHWECTLAVPNGIETRCTEYHYKGK